MLFFTGSLVIVLFYTIYNGVKIDIIATEGRKFAKIKAFFLTILTVSGITLTGICVWQLM